jgi:sortase A
MANLFRGQRAVLILVAVACATLLGVSGWFFAVANGKAPSSHARVATRASAAPASSTAPLPSAATPDTSAQAVEPAKLLISRLGVQAPIENKGIDSHNQMEAPDRPFDVAWYPFTAKPGSGGNAVFAGHKDFAGVGPAVFWRLGERGVGDTIDVMGGDQKQLHYRVTDTWDYTVATIPMASVLAQGGGDQVTLITCAGSYSQSSGYDHRLVVRAQRTA